MLATRSRAFASVLRACCASRCASTAATVLYGSQTGNAMGFAMQLNEALSERGESTVCDLYDYKGPALLEAAKKGADAPLHVFVVSCFGKGEPSDSAKKFWAWLFAPERDAEHAASVAAGSGPLLRGLPFTVFGLGSSQTHSQHYNVVGRKLDDRLAALGGSRHFARGEGDDSGVLELDFEAWQAKLVESLNAKTKAGDAAGAGSAAGAAAPATAAAAAAAPAPAEAAAAVAAAGAEAAACAIPSQKPVEFGGRAWSETAASAYISRPTATGAPGTFFRIVPQPAGDAAAFAALDSLPPLAVLSSSGERSMVPLPVTATSTLSPLGGRESRPVVELTFDMAAGPQASPPLSLSYITGDHVSVLPEADDAAVLALCERCNWDPELPFVLKPPAATCETGPATAAAAPQQRMPLPGATTVRNALKRHVDVGASLSPAMLRLLAAHASDASEAAALQRLASDASAYKGAVRGRFIRLLDALHAFPSVRLPLDRLLASWPILTPRYYSISSSSAAPDSAEGAPAALAATLAAASGAGDAHVSTAASGRRSMMLTFKHLRYALAAGAPGSDAALEKGAAAADAAIAEWHSRGIGRAISHGLPASALAGPDGRVWSGLASTYMATRRPGDAVTVAVRPSSFRLPVDPAAPVVFVAGGIGVAPYRGLIESRIWLATALGTASSGGSRLGRATLLYGCRGAYDHVYAGLFREALACGALTAVDVGYGDGGAAPEPAGEGSPEEAALRAAYLARGDGRAGRPVLADELVMRHGDAVWEALTQGGAVYVCGGASGFGAAVSRAVKSIIMTRAGLTEAAAQEHLFRHVEEGRFVEDLAD